MLDNFSGDFPAYETESFCFFLAVWSERNVAIFVFFRIFQFNSKVAVTEKLICKVAVTEKLICKVAVTEKLICTLFSIVLPGYELDFGFVILGDIVTKSVRLINNGNCPVSLFMLRSVIK